MTVPTKCLICVLAVCAVQAFSTSAHAQYIPFPMFRSQPRITGFTVNPFSGAVTPRTFDHTVYNSYFDPFRNYVAPGSYRRVDQWHYDPQSGQRVYRQGYQWNNQVTNQPHAEYYDTVYAPDGTPLNTSRRSTAFRGRSSPNEIPGYAVP